MEYPKSYYVYELSYPQEMPGCSEVVFYVGKGTNGSRMDDHLNEASRNCECDKCKAIRSIWNAGLIVIRRIVFESPSESEAFKEEKRRILLHQSPYLTNILDSPVGLKKKGMVPRRQRTEEEASQMTTRLPMRPATELNMSDINIRLPFEGGEAIFSLAQWYRMKMQCLPATREYQVTSITINSTIPDQPPTVVVEGIYLLVS